MLKHYLTAPCFLLIFCTMATSLVAQESPVTSELGRQNVSYLYNLQSPLTADTRVAMGQGEATIFFKLNIRDINAEISNISYRVQASYEDTDNAIEGNIGTTELIRENDRSQIYRFTIPVTETTNYLFVFVDGSIRNQAIRLRFDTSLNTNLNFPFTDLLVMEADEDVPVFSNFLPRDANFRIVSLYNGLNKAFVYYYGHEFEPNPPPMANSANQVQKSLEIDSIFPVELGNKLTFAKEGLYFTQTDTTSLSGIAFRIEQSYYPRFVTAEKLIQPIRYISTSDEMAALQNDEDEKLAMDRYWIKATRSRDRAKEVIKKYYRQVTKSNILFSNYKEGWKTSQGMVYLLYGAPDQVYRSTGKETWIYNDDSNLMQDMLFNFVKVRNIFTNEHYNLVPSETYSKFWFRNIDLWRKGRKEI